jgi:hypothetical protein
MKNISSVSVKNLSIAPQREGFNSAFTTLLSVVMVSAAWVAIGFYRMYDTQILSFFKSDK